MVQESKLCFCMSCLSSLQQSLAKYDWQSIFCWPKKNKVTLFVYKNKHAFLINPAQHVQRPVKSKQDRTYYYACHRKIAWQFCRFVILHFLNEIWVDNIEVALKHRAVIICAFPYTCNVWSMLNPIFINVSQKIKDWNVVFCMLTD